jgi:hypothetical protein
MLLEFHVNDCASHQGLLDLLLVNSFSRISLDRGTFELLPFSITNVAKILVEVSTFAPKMQHG